MFCAPRGPLPQIKLVGLARQTAIPGQEPGQRRLLHRAKQRVALGDHDRRRRHRNHRHVRPPPPAAPVPGRGPRRSSDRTNASQYRSRAGNLCAVAAPRIGNWIPGIVGGPILVAHSESAAIVVSHLEVFRDGIELPYAVYLREPEAFEEPVEREQKRPTLPTPNSPVATRHSSADSASRSQSTSQTALGSRSTSRLGHSRTEPSLRGTSLGQGSTAAAVSAMADATEPISFFGRSPAQACSG